MNPKPVISKHRYVRIARLLYPPAAAPPVYRAGEPVAPGVYRELERGVVVSLARRMPLPDLNSYEPSRFFRWAPAGWLSRWFGRPDSGLDCRIQYHAGQLAAAGTYQDMERQIVVRLGTAGPLPDLQTAEPSRYRRLRSEKVCVRRIGMRRA